MRRASLQILLVAAAVVGAATGCRPPASRTTVERIAGAPRLRAFASSTAYEAFLRAEVMAARGDLAGAVRQLELAEVADPSDAYLPSRRAELLLLVGERDEALDAAREATRRFPQAAAGWLALGEVLTARGDRPGATGAFTRALSLAPDDPEVRGAVARAQGAEPADVARAIEGAPDARPGDRTVAHRMALDPLRDDRPTLRSARRERARRAWARRAYREVDRILTPIVLADPSDVADRVLLIEARARDGRPGDAARLVPGVPVRAGSVSAAERARLWLIAGRAEIAVEEAERALDTEPSDVLARLVLGTALTRTGHAGRGIALLAGVPADSPRFVEARIAAADALVRGGRGDLADVALERAEALLAADDGAGRDRLRITRAALLMRRGATAEARSALARVESPGGRQQRGALLAQVEAPAAVLADLRVRTGERSDDAVADAWIALVCRRRPDACAAGEGEAALRAAREHAPGAPETLRAMALWTPDRRAAADLLREATARDPLSPWNASVPAQIGTSGRPRGQ